MSLRILVTGAATELGLETVRHLVANGHTVTGLIEGKKDQAQQVTSSGGSSLTVDPGDVSALKQAIDKSRAEVILNVAPQFANNMVNDGHDWKDYDKTLPVNTSALLHATAAANSPIKLLVHTSFAFLYGNTTNATEETPIQAIANDQIFTACKRTEDLVQINKIPACILRMGYLYGPQSQDLYLYIKSFKLHRLYWAGPKGKLANWLHFEDAAAVLTTVAEGGSNVAGQVFNVVDGVPAGFDQFIDCFASELGLGHQPHIPLWGAPLARATIIRPQHMELTATSTTVKNDKLRQYLGWTPKYSSYREGLAQTVAKWRSEGKRGV